MKISLIEATRFLLRGDVIAVPTETVYGLAARVCDRRAVRQIFRIKGRPADNPLIVHVATLTQMRSLVCRIPPAFKRVQHFWPGPLTIVMPANKKSVPSRIRASLPTVALRMPAHPLMRKLIQKVGPLAAPSANPSGRPSPTCVSHVHVDYGNEFPVLDGGRCRHGVESTVIALGEDGSWSLLRAGAVPIQKLEQHLGPACIASPGAKKGNGPLSPGMKYRHYAPRARLIPAKKSGRKYLESAVKGHRDVAAVIGFNDTHTRLPLISLGRRGSYATNLRRLYSALRQVDRVGARKALVDMDFASTGLGQTLHDRLWRALGKRIIKNN